jgi:hypothetical protein
MRHNLFVILLALASLTASADEPAFKPLTPAERSAALQSASTTGEALYRHDQAAWHATDALMALWKNSPDSRVAGWIRCGRGRAGQRAGRSGAAERL